jgi:hypothetical protein
LSLGLALALVAAPAIQSAPAFDPLAFFTGSSKGEGKLKVAMKASVPVQVESHGRPDGRGGITLDQTIREGSSPPRQRRWALRPTSATTLTGTITDTPGRVSGHLKANRLVLSYMMKGGLKAEQVLTLQPGGRTVVNRMTVRKFGIPVAHVEEVITKLD